MRLFDGFLIFGKNLFLSKNIIGKKIHQNCFLSETIKEMKIYWVNTTKGQYCLIIKIHHYITMTKIELHQMAKNSTRFQIMKYIFKVIIPHLFSEQDLYSSIAKLVHTKHIPTYNQLQNLPHHIMYRKQEDPFH